MAELTEEERAAAMAALDRLSEFRFVYWTADRKALSYKVRRDAEHRSDRWGLFDGDWIAWDGEEWQEMGPRPEAFRWSLHEALKIAERLAYEENQHLIDVMEKKFPGKFKGGEFDFARTRTGAPDRRLEVTPEPLKIGEAKPGGPVPEPEFLFCRRWRKGELLAASIHRDGCKMAPEDGHELRDGSWWGVDKITADQVKGAVGWAANQHVEASVECKTCRGWSVT